MENNQSEINENNLIYIDDFLKKRLSEESKSRKESYSQIISTEESNSIFELANSIIDW